MTQLTEQTKDEEQQKSKEYLDLQAKCEEYLAGWKRAQADYQNLKREHGEQMKRLTEIVNAGLLTQLLPIIDHYDLAIKHVPEEQSGEEWAQGFYHIRKQFDDFLTKNGVKRIATVGKQFDPHLHEAVGVKDGEQDNVVLEETQAGYMLGEQVLRHAKVVVSK